MNFIKTSFFAETKIENVILGKIVENYGNINL
jgi:hypothetical protein